MQLELLPAQDLSVIPENGRSQPRLWVKRLVIWSEPDKPLRDISLKPGLNVVWSPDPGHASGSPIGHGGGKTAFCRLLRYCLGEDNFAPDGQRQRIWQAFPKGFVGVEVYLEGHLWIILRSLSDRRRDVVIEGGSFEEAIASTEKTAGLELFRSKVVETIVRDAARLMPAEIGEGRSWEAALAWMTRDQECRLSDPLEWRNPHTDSRSPVRRLSAESRRFVMRALVGSLTAAELDEQRSANRSDEAVNRLEAEISRLRWSVEKTRRDLTRTLGEDAGTGVGTSLDAVTLKIAAAQNMARAAQLPTDATVIDLTEARARRDKLFAEYQRCERLLSDANVRLPEIGETLRKLRSISVEASARKTTQDQLVCPLCNVLLDNALAEGCGLRAEDCDMDALRQEYSSIRSEIERTALQQQQLTNTIPGLERDVAAARAPFETSKDTVERLEKAFSNRSDELKAAQRILDDAERYLVSISDIEARLSDLEKVKRELADSKGRLSSLREQATSTMRRLSELFLAVLRYFVPGPVEGGIGIDGNGLQLRALGAEGATAIESLKIVAFDLAALCLTIEGRTNLPSFLIHDSPREGDLGESIYERLFDLARRLEDVGPEPLFQYIITTTSAPPPAFREPPFLALELHRAPADQRLFRTDL